MAAFYYTAGKSASRRDRLQRVRRTPEPMAGHAFTEACRLPPAVARRAAPIAALLCDLGFEAPFYAITENLLAMEPDAHLLFRHGSGYALAAVTLRWGEPPCYRFLSLLHGGDREERLLTSSERLPRQRLPAQTRRASFAWPWPRHDAAALWEIHCRAVSQTPRRLTTPLPTDEALLSLYDAFRLDLHRRALTTQHSRAIPTATFTAARRRMEAARAYGRRIAATGERHALFFARLHETANRPPRILRLQGPILLLLIAGGMIALGAEQRLLLWAAGGAAIYSFARCWASWAVGNEEQRPLAMALAGPLLLGLGAIALAGTAPPASLLFTLSALTLLLPIPGLEGGEIIEATLYRRSPWIKPLLYLAAGGAIGYWGWQEGLLFLAWIGGVIALAPLLDPQRPLLVRRLRKNIDWSGGATPEAVSAMITTLEKQKRRVSDDLLITLYHGIIRRAPPLRATLGGLLLYGAALTLPLLPASRWLLDHPQLTLIASAAAPGRPSPIEVPDLPAASPAFLPAAAEWEGAPP